MKTKTSDLSVEPGVALEDPEPEFTPIVRSGACADVGFRSNMEDVYVCMDNFTRDNGLKSFTDGPSAFYGVIILLLLSMTLHVSLCPLLYRC